MRRRPEEIKTRFEQQNKVMADYRAQADKPFEHEARLKGLLAKQAQLNAVLDLDKHEAQTVADSEGEKELPASFAAKVMAEERVAMAVH